MHFKYIFYVYNIMLTCGTYTITNRFFEYYTSKTFFHNNNNKKKNLMFMYKLWSFLFD